MHKRRRLCMLAIGLAESKPSSEARKRAASVPLVGCEAEGQMGPWNAPDGKTVHALISADFASRLA